MLGMGLGQVLHRSVPQCPHLAEVEHYLKTCTSKLLLKDGTIVIPSDKRTGTQQGLSYLSVTRYPVSGEAEIQTLEVWLFLITLDCLS